MRIFIWMLGLMLLSTNAQAALKRQTVDYKQGDTTLEGYLVYDDTAVNKRPGIVLVHDWMGVGPYVQGRADQMAQLGYVVLAADIYGKGVRPKDKDEAAKQAGIYKGDRKLMRARAQAALDELLGHPTVDAKRVAAIGYCFGGTVALEMARASMPVAGVVTFHGGLSTNMPAEKGAVKAKILNLHGADDPFVPPAEVADYQKEMNSAGADWQMVYYSGAVHSFTRPDSGNDNSKGMAYNEKADKRSWAAMQTFLGEVFKE